MVSIDGSDQVQKFACFADLSLYGLCLWFRHILTVFRDSMGDGAIHRRGVLAFFFRPFQHRPWSICSPTNAAAAADSPRESPQWRMVARRRHRCCTTKVEGPLAESRLCQASPPVPSGFLSHVGRATVRGPKHHRHGCTRSDASIELGQTNRDCV